MNWLKKGPELKMPSLSKLRGSGVKAPGLKAPDFLVDLYWDLRDRHLLPLVALAIVAIVAVPFLLDGGSEPESVTSTGGAGAAISSVPAGSAELVVVEAKPGLRDYRKRLRKRKPTDPFNQRYSAPVLDGTELGSGGEGPSDGGSMTSTSVTRTSSSTTKTTKTTSTEGDTTTTTTTDTPGGTPDELTLFTFAVEVKVVRTATKADGSKDKKTKTMHRVLPPAALPSEKAQVVTYMGISPTTQKPLLLISDRVGAVYGEAKCLSGSDSCQLLEVDVGLPLTFVHDPDGVRYKITILDVEPVLTGQAGPSTEE